MSTSLDDLRVGDLIVIRRAFRPCAPNEATDLAVVEWPILYGFPVIVQGVSLPFLSVQPPRESGFSKHIVDTRGGFEYTRPTREYASLFTYTRKENANVPTRRRTFIPPSAFPK